MMARRFALFAVMLGTLCFLTAARAGDDDKTDKKTDKKAPTEAKFTAKCPVSGKAAIKECSAAYAKKDVYFCCAKCKAAFEADNTKFTTKANHQLYQTKQYRQTKCPISGSKLNKDTMVKVAGTRVRFCCAKCKAKAEAASGDDQIAMVFGAEAFKKGFVVRKEKKGQSDKVKKDTGA
jgi:YHS domain-containing protein